jgi:hypothetical protein
LKWCSIPGAVAVAAVMSLNPIPADAATVISWSMDETRGHTMHDRTGTYNGTIQGGVILGVDGHRIDDGDRWRRGRHRDDDRAYKFTGDGDVVVVPHASALNPGSARFSVSIYFKSYTKPSSVGADSFDLARKGLSTTAGGDWKLEVRPNGRVFCHFRGARSVDLLGTSNVVDGSWNKVECTKSSSGVRLRVNGSTEASSDADPGRVSNRAPLTVGAKSASSDGTVGRLDALTLRKG